MLLSLKQEFFLSKDSVCAVHNFIYCFLQKKHLQHIWWNPFVQKMSVSAQSEVEKRLWSSKTAPFSVSFIIYCPTAAIKLQRQAKAGLPFPACKHTCCCKVMDDLGLPPLLHHNHQKLSYFLPAVKQKPAFSSLALQFDYSRSCLHVMWSICVSMSLFTDWDAFRWHAKCALISREEYLTLQRRIKKQTADWHHEVKIWLHLHQASL